MNRRDLWILGMLLCFAGAIAVAGIRFMQAARDRELPRPLVEQLSSPIRKWRVVHDELQRTNPPRRFVKILVPKNSSREELAAFHAESRQDLKGNPDIYINFYNSLPATIDSFVASDVGDGHLLFSGP
jgi:hypothetical protein